MQYLEDIVELVEDVPHELQRRGALIQEWDRQAYEHKLDADRLTKKLETDPTLTDDEKARIFGQIAERLERARDATKKKVDMSCKTHRLFQAIFERVNEFTYHCKLELEVDAPGCTAGTERAFLNESMMVATAAANSSGGISIASSPKDEPLSRATSVFTSRESTPYSLNVPSRPILHVPDKRARGISLNTMNTSSRSSSSQPEKRKKKSLVSYDSGLPMSAYMRKKKERLREQKKLMEVHASRNRVASERERSIVSIKQEPIDLSDVPAYPDVNAIDIHPEHANTPGSGQDDNGGLFSGDEDDLLNLFPDLPSPMELVGGLDDENIFDFAEFHAGLGKAIEKIEASSPRPCSPHTYGMHNAPTSRLSAGGGLRESEEYKAPRTPTGLTPSTDRKKRPLMSFGIGESMHGRPRKLTNRAEEMLSEIERKEREKRRKEGDEDEDVDNTPYCYCRKPSEGNMVGCDGEHCPYKWFHMECLNMTEAPKTDKWFCNDCRKYTKR